MRGLRFVILGVAVAAGVGAVALVRSELDRARGNQVVVTKPAPAPTSEQVLVAARALKMGEKLKPEDLRWQSWPKAALSEFYVTQGKQPRAQQDVEGVIVRSDMVAGEPVTEAKLIRLSKPGVMSAFIRRGMRGLSIAVSATSTAGTFVLPGDYVDVIMTTRIEVEDGSDEGGGEEEALIGRTLVAAVRVLAIDEQFQPGAAASTGSNRTATLEVTPEQAEVLALAETAGELRLALRSVSELIPPLGQKPIEPVPVLVFDPRTAPEAEIGEKPQGVQVVRFNRKQTIALEE